MRTIEPGIRKLPVNEWAIVHDGKKVIAVAGPGVTVGTPENIIAGTPAELLAEIGRLGLEISDASRQRLEQV